MDISSIFVGIILTLLFAIALILHMWYRDRSKCDQELNEAYERMEELAKYDPLTQLYNHHSMMDRIEIEMIKMGRSWRPFCLIMINIDNFREINDKYGHDCGDKILESLGLILTKSLRKQDAASRWGSQEFLLMLPETLLEGGSVIAEKIRKRVEETKVTYGDITLTFTITLGIDVYKKTGPANLSINMAYAAMYEGMKRGKNILIRSDDPTLKLSGIEDQDGQPPGQTKS